MFIIVNALVFQIAWFVSVVGGAQQMPWLGPLSLLVALAIHLKAARHPIEELALVLLCGLIGAAFDSILVVNNWVSYSSGVFNEAMAPYWIITMWMLFATTLNVSMRWFRRKPAIAAVFGFFGGPLSYIAGEKLSGITLLEPVAALLALGIGWAIMMPLLMRLSEYFDGMPAKPTLRPQWQTEVQEC